MWVGSERSTLCASANEELGTLADNTPLTVVTNDKHIAEQIKSASTLPVRECLLTRKVESTVMDGVKSETKSLGEEH